MAENIMLTRRVKYAGDVHTELLKAGWSLDAATAFLNNIPDANVEPVGYVPFREIPQTVVCKDYHNGWYSRILCPVCGKMQKNAKRNISKWYCERCGQALTMDGE